MRRIVNINFDAESIGYYLGLLCFSGAPWTDEQRRAMLKHLGHLIQLRRAPRKLECLSATKAEPILNDRDWKSVKDFIASKVHYASLADNK